MISAFVISDWNYTLAREALMPIDITYNLIISYTNTSLTCNVIKKSFTEKGQLILILENSQKIIIPGKNIDTSGHKKRVREYVSMAGEKRFDIPEKSIKHYASGKDVEYVLVKW